MLYRRGLSSSVKTGIVVLLIVIVLAAAYVVPSMKGTKATTVNTTSGPNPITDTKLGMLALSETFPDMEMVVNVDDIADQFVSNETFSYSVISPGTINGTQLTRIEFVTLGVGNDVVGWFNSTGGVVDVEVLGQRNYTGSGAYTLPYLTSYTNTFELLQTITTNSTLLSMLSKSTSGGGQIGSVSVDETTYVLGVATGSYTAITAKYATVPGTNIAMAVYLSEKMSDGSSTEIEVTSLTR